VGWWVVDTFDLGLVVVGSGVAFVLLVICWVGFGGRDWVYVVGCLLWFGGFVVGCYRWFDVVVVAWGSLVICFDLLGVWFVCICWFVCSWMFLCCVGVFGGLGWALVIMIVYVYLLVGFGCCCVCFGLGGVTCGFDLVVLFECCTCYVGCWLLLFIGLIFFVECVWVNVVCYCCVITVIWVVVSICI